MPEYEEPARATKPSAAITAAPLPKPKSTELTSELIKSAVAYNNTRWKDPHRSEVLAKLRVERGADVFDDQDIRAIAVLQKREGIPFDGKLTGPTMAALLRSGLHLTEIKAKPEEVRLVFYPGEFEDLAAWRKAKADAIAANGGKPLGGSEFGQVTARRPPGHGTIYVELRGNVVDAIQARGGPPFSMKDDSHTADPSKAGTYKLGTGKSVVTSSWAYSQIAWGAPIRETAGEIQFKNPGEDWQFATGPKARLATPLERADFVEPDGTVTKQWRKNDFGETGFRIEGSPGLFIHTGPDTEELLRKEQEEHKVHAPLELAGSHGCLHVEPTDRNRLMKTGYLQKGVTLVIKRYDESLDPKARGRK